LTTFVRTNKNKKLVYNILKTVHSYWAYLVLFSLLLALINALIGFLGTKTFTDKDRKISLLGLIATHIQLVLAMFLYFFSPYYNTMKEIGIGEVMKNSALRLYCIEHPFINLTAIILVTIGWSKHKTKTINKEKFKSIWLMYLIALVLFFSRIPYRVWWSF